MPLGVGYSTHCTILLIFQVCQMKYVRNSNGTLTAGIDPKLEASPYIHYYGYMFDKNLSLSYAYSMGKNWQVCDFKFKEVQGLWLINLIYKIMEISAATLWPAICSKYYALWRSDKSPAAKTTLCISSPRAHTCPFRTMCLLTCTWTGFAHHVLTTL